MTSAFSDRFIQGRSGFAKVEYRAMSNVKDGDLHAYLTAPYILKEQCRRPKRYTPNSFGKFILDLHLNILYNLYLRYTFIQCCAVERNDGKDIYGRITVVFCNMATISTVHQTERRL